MRFRKINVVLIHRHGPVAIARRATHGHFDDMGFIPHKTAEIEVLRLVDKVQHGKQLLIAGDPTAVQAHVEFDTDQHILPQAAGKLIVLGDPLGGVQ